MVPGTAFFEMALASASSLVTDPTAETLLEAAAITAPCMLTTPAAAEPTAAATGQALLCVANPGDATTLEIRSAAENNPKGAGLAQSVLHFSSLAAAAVASTAGSAVAAPASQSTVADCLIGEQTMRERSDGRLQLATVASVAAPLHCAGLLTPPLTKHRREALMPACQESCSLGS